MKNEIDVFGISSSKVNVDRIKSSEEYEGFIYALDGINEGTVKLNKIIDLIEDYYDTVVDVYDLDGKRKKAYFLCTNGMEIVIPIMGVHVYSR